MGAPDVATVIAWHEALNAGDIDGLLALSSDDIEVGGPRGAGRGAHLLRDWVGRADIRLTPRRVFHRAGTVVVEESARWRSPETEQMTEPQGAASVFRVHDGRVTRVVRYPDVISALQAAGLDDADADAASTNDRALNP